MSIELQGNWKKGFAYDVHTLASNYLGVDEQGHARWDNVRSVAWIGRAWAEKDRR